MNTINQQIRNLEAKYNACTGREAYAIGNKLRTKQQEFRDLNLRLSNEFSRIVNREFSNEELAEVVKRNNTPEYTDCCATHDFCDANELMAEAFKTVFGREVDPQNEDDCESWNIAWSLSKDSHFSV